jgi:hypothetical protein
MTVSNDSIEQVNADFQNEARNLSSKERILLASEIGKEGNIDFFNTILKVEKESSSQLKDSIPLIRSHCIASAAIYGHRNMVFKIIDNAELLEKDSLRGIAYLFAVANRKQQLADSILTSGNIPAKFLAVEAQ